MHTLSEHGFHRGIPAADYHASDYVSPSRAKSALISALQYQYDSTHVSEPTPEMDFGTLAHAMFLEPDSLPLNFVVWNGGRRIGNTWNQFVAANADKRILTQDEYRTAIAVRDSLHQHDAVRSLVNSSGDREISIRWRDSKTGIECRGRIDYLRSGIIADLKTIQCVTDRAIVANCLRYHYPLSMAAYRDGLEHLNVHECACYLIFVCSRPPHDVSVKLIELDELLFGLRQWRKALDVIATASKSGNYPGISNEIKPLILPAWAMEDGEDLDLDWKE